jgi:hypothetical protein
MNTRHFKNGSNSKSHPTSQASVADRSALREEEFLRVIWHERKRAERSQKPAVLMLVEIEAQFHGERNREPLQAILSALSAATRETDVTGWYKDDCVVGVLFTEIAVEDGNSIVTAVMSRVSQALRSQLTSRQFNQVVASFHLFPEETSQQIPAMPVNPALYPNLATLDDAVRMVQR